MSKGLRSDTGCEADVVATACGYLHGDGCSKVKMRSQILKLSSARVLGPSLPLVPLLGRGGVRESQGEGRTSSVKRCCSIE